MNKAVIFIVGAVIIVIGVVLLLSSSSPINRFVGGSFTVDYDGYIYVPRLGINQSFEATYGQGTVRHGFIVVNNDFGLAWSYNGSLLVCPWTRLGGAEECININMGNETGRSSDEFYREIDGLYCYRYIAYVNKSSTLPSLPLHLSISRIYNLTIVPCLNQNGVPINVNSTLSINVEENGLLKIEMPITLEVSMHATKVMTGFNETLYNELIGKQQSIS